MIFEPILKTCKPLETLGLRTVQFCDDKILLIPYPVIHKELLSMDDLHYDAIQKKIVARGAKARVCGSKSKRCSLPSDRMTQKQWKERCGNVVEYNLSKPMSWRELKSMPVDLQVEYLKKLSSTFALSMKHLSGMLGVNPNTVRVHLKEIGAYKYFSHGNGYKMPSGSLQAFEQFLGMDTAGADETKTEALYECSSGIYSPMCDYPAPIVEKSKLNSFKFSMSGPADLTSIMNSIRLFVQDGDNVDIEISGFFKN